MSLEKEESKVMAIQILYAFIKGFIGFGAFINTLISYLF